MIHYICIPVVLKFAINTMELLYGLSVNHSYEMEENRDVDGYIKIGGVTVDIRANDSRTISLGEVLHF